MPVVNWLRKVIRNHFGFSQREANGTLVIFMIMAMLFLTPFATEWYITKTAVVPSREAYLDSLITVLEKADTAQKRDKNNWQPDRLIDPNETNPDSLIAAGLPSWLAYRLTKYTKAGGKFKKPQDLKKLYGLRTEDYEKLLPFIKIETAYTRKAYQSEFYKKKRKGWQLKHHFDPNTTDPGELTAAGLPDWLAERITKYTKAGGSFKKPKDLKKLYGLRDGDYEKMESFINIKPAANDAGNGSKYAVDHSRRRKAATTTRINTSISRKLLLLLI